MVSNTIQCGFESHPGHPALADVGNRLSAPFGTIDRVYSDDVRQRAAALARHGLTLSEASRLTGVSRSALRTWRAGRARTMPPHGCPRCGGTMLDERAYAALLGFYLGDGCLSKYPRYFALRVSCDAAYPEIVDDVRRTIIAVRPGRQVFLVEAPGVVVVQAHWQHWPCLFPQHGPGRKHERAIVLGDWQAAIVAAHPADFLRGLFHSDGSRVRNWASRVVAGERRRYDYPRWQFPSPQPELARAGTGEEIEEGRHASERSDEECDPSRNPMRDEGTNRPR